MICVVSHLRKNHLFKTEFLVHSANNKSIWTKLKRSENKTGLDFTPLRKVDYLFTNSYK